MVIAGVEGSVHWKIMVRAETVIRAAGVGFSARLPRQKFWQLGVETGVIVEAVEPEALDAIRGAEIEKLVVGPGFLVGAINGAGPAALRVSHGKRRHVRKQSAPSDSEASPVAMGRKIRLARQSEGPGAIVVVPVTNRSREIA